MNDIRDWNRSIRPWIYYTDDNPTIWQTRKAEHPSRNAMFMPTAPKKATAYAFISINNNHGCFCMFDINEINERIQSEKTLNAISDKSKLKNNFDDIFVPS